MSIVEELIAQTRCFIIINSEIRTLPLLIWNPDESSITLDFAKSRQGRVQLLKLCICSQQSSSYGVDSKAPYTGSFDEKLVPDNLILLKASPGESEGSKSNPESPRVCAVGREGDQEATKAESNAISTRLAVNEPFAQGLGSMRPK
jgi:hypothetical protein